MLNENVKSFLDSTFVKNLEGKKVLVISDIENRTDDDIDIELVSRKFARAIRNSKKFVLTNAIAGSGSKKDKMIKNTRLLRNNEEYNQYTTKEKGGLLAPDYSLAGKITQRKRNIGKEVRVDYQFLIVLSDIKTGIVVWDNETRISKVIAKDKLREFDQAQSEQDSYTKKGRIKEFFRNLWDKTKNVVSGVGKNYQSSNHIVLGMDLGFGGGTINMPPVDFSLIRVSSGYYGSSTTENHTLYLSNIYSKNNFIMPINIRIGYLRNISDNWAFGLNFIYNYTVTPTFDSADELEATTSDINNINNKKLTSTINRLGGEFLVYYKLRDSFHIFAGGGVLTDVYSKYNVSFDTRKSDFNHYDTSINVQGQKRFNVETKIDSWYPIIKIGGLFNFERFGIDSAFYCSWATKEENYLGTNCGVSAGVQVKY